MALCVIDLNTLISQPSPNVRDQHTYMGGETMQLPTDLSLKRE